jgi:hypothetical protein
MEKSPVLNWSSELMLSDDYKDRFKAEYIQLDIRLKKLQRMMEDWDLGLLKFEPTCPKETYHIQWKAMNDYRNILVTRAKIEGIDITY